MLAVLSTMLVLAATLPGLLWVLHKPTHRIPMSVVLLVFLAPVLIVGMSRIRVPAEPLMLILTAGFLVHLRDRRSPRTWETVAVIVGWVTLAALWLINAPEVLMQLDAVY